MVLLWLLGLILVALGVLGFRLGLPLKETAFGSALVVAASVATVGGFILAGLAMVVSELRRIARQLRNERRETDGGRGAGRRVEPRLDGPANPDAGIIASRFDPPFAAPVRDRADRAQGQGAPGGAAVTAAGGKKAREPSLEPSPVPSPEPSPVPGPVPGREGGLQSTREPGGEWGREGARPEPVAVPAGIVLPAPAPAQPAAPSQAVPGLAGKPAAAQGVKLPWRALRPAPMASDGAAAAATDRPAPRVLKTGSINEVPYTLFSDGSVETPAEDGTLRFASIDEFRRHIETGAD